MKQGGSFETLDLRLFKVFPETWSRLVWGTMLFGLMRTEAAVRRWPKLYTIHIINTWRRNPPQHWECKSLQKANVEAVRLQPHSFCYCFHLESNPPTCWLLGGSTGARAHHEWKTNFCKEGAAGRCRWPTAAYCLHSCSAPLNSLWASADRRADRQTVRFSGLGCVCPSKKKPHTPLVILRKTWRDDAFWQCSGV